MKALACLIVLLWIGMIACQPSNTVPNNPPVDTTGVTPPPPPPPVTVTAAKVAGWWGAYPQDPNNPLEYNRLYFGPDSFYLQGVFGMNWDAYWWLKGDSMYINDGGGVGSRKVRIVYSPDTLLIFEAGSTHASYVRVDSPMITSAPMFTVAGDGTIGNSGDGGPATAARFYYPGAMAMDAQENIYISDDNNVIRKISSSDGTISRVAGMINNFGYFGDGGPALAAQINYPPGLAVDSKGNIYMTDNKYYSVREILASDSTIHTIAGQPGPNGSGFSGDGGPAVYAQLSQPLSIAVDGNDNIYITDFNRIRKISAADGTITTVAGTGVRGHTGDNGPAIAAELSPGAMTVDKAGNIYVTDASTIRKIDAGTGIIHTIAGTGTPGYNGEGHDAGNAQLDGPGTMLLDAAGNLVFADGYRIRMIRAADARIFTVAGAGVQGFSKDSRHATTCQISGAGGIVENHLGEIIFSDWSNNRLRKTRLQ